MKNHSLRVWCCEDSYGHDLRPNFHQLQGGLFQHIFLIVDALMEIGLLLLLVLEQTVLPDERRLQLISMREGRMISISFHEEIRNS